MEVIWFVGYGDGCSTIDHRGEFDCCGTPGTSDAGIDTIGDACEQCRIVMTEEIDES